MLGEKDAGRCGKREKKKAISEELKGIPAILIKTQELTEIKRKKTLTSKSKELPLGGKSCRR